MSSTAKLFMHGRSQAVRLPKEFRFEGTEVRVSKVGDKVILEPLKKPPFDAEAGSRELDELGEGISSPTAFQTIRRPNLIHACSSTNDLSRHQYRDLRHQPPHSLAAASSRQSRCGSARRLGFP